MNEVIPFRNTADMLDYELRLRCLSRSFVRYVVEKHGGRIAINPQTETTEIAVPAETEDACFKELETLLEYAYS